MARWEPSFNMGTPTLTPAQIASYYVITPEEAYAGARWQEQRYATLPKVNWCTQAMQDNVTPLVPGELGGVVGYSGDAKTMWGLAQAYHTAKEILAAKKDLTHRVIYYTWDQPAELLEMKLERMIRHDRAFRRNIPIDQVKYGIADRIALPLWFAGKSAKKNIEQRQGERPVKIPELTVERIGDVLDYICDKGQKEIGLLIADYAQRISTNKRENRFEMVLRVAELLGDFVTTRSVPGIVLLQSGRDVKGRADKTPHINDIQDSSGLEKVLDKGWGQWVPSNTEREGTLIQVGKLQIPTVRGLVKCNKFKDREGAANVEFAYMFDFATGRIGDYTEKKP